MKRAPVLRESSTGERPGDSGLRARAPHPSPRLLSFPLHRARADPPSQPFLKMGLPLLPSNSCILQSDRNSTSNCFWETDLPGSFHYPFQRLHNNEG